MQKYNSDKDGGVVKKKKTGAKCLFVHVCALVGLFKACDLVHAVFFSVAADKQYCYLMKLLSIKKILCTYHHVTVLFSLCHFNHVRFFTAFTNYKYIEIAVETKK